MSGYDKARLVHVPHKQRVKEKWHSRATSEKCISDILKDAGYSQKQISKMNNQGRILIGTKYTSTTLKPGQKLYVLDIPEDYNIEDYVDRFQDLELD